MSELNQSRTPWAKPWPRALIGVVLLVLLVLDTFAIYQIYTKRMGNALDYYPFWAGGQEVLLHRRNPYEPEVMRSIQEAIYGRPALPEENQHGYAYPAFTPLLVSLFLVLPFSLSASIWIAFQQVLLVTSVVLTAKATRWEVGFWHLLLLCVAAMTFRYAMIAFVLGQTSTWVLFCLSLALWAAARGHSGWAGLALAAGLVKPQLVLLPALALLVSLPPGRRLRLVLSLGGLTILLLIGSWLLVGFWLGDYWQLLRWYQSYSSSEFPILGVAQTWLSPGTSQIVNWVAIGGLLVVFGATLWRARGSGRVVLPVAMAMVVTQFVVPQTGGYNLVLLVLPAVVALERFSTVQGRLHGHAVAGRVTVWMILVIVPWVLFPLIKGDRGIPVDLVVMPLLVLLVMLGSLCLEWQRPDANEPAGEKAGAA